MLTKGRDSDLKICKCEIPNRKNKIKRSADEDNSDTLDLAKHGSKNEEESIVSKN